MDNMDNSNSTSLKQSRRIKLTEAIKESNLEKVKIIFQEVGDTIAYVGESNNSPLHLAAKYGSAVILKWMLKNTAVPKVMKNQRKETCAHVAAKYNQIKCLRIILSCSGLKPIEFASFRDLNGMTILHLAAVLSNVEIVSYLVNTFGKTLALVTTENGQTALHFSAAKGDIRCLQAMSNLSGLVINCRDDLGCTALFYAAQQGHLDVVKYLVTKTRAHTDICAVDGTSVLMAAIQNGNEHVVRCLLAEEAVNISEKNDRAQPVLLELVLCQSGAEFLIDSMDKQGNTAAHLASRAAVLRSFQLLYDAQADLQLQNNAGETPISICLASTNKDLKDYVEKLATQDAAFYSLPSVASQASPDEYQLNGRIGLVKKMTERFQNGSVNSKQLNLEIEHGEFLMRKRNGTTRTSSGNSCRHLFRQNHRNSLISLPTTNKMSPHQHNTLLNGHHDRSLQAAMRNIMEDMATEKTVDDITAQEMEEADEDLKAHAKLLELDYESEFINEPSDYADEMNSDDDNTTAGSDLYVINNSTIPPTPTFRPPTPPPLPPIRVQPTSPPVFRRNKLSEQKPANDVQVNHRNILPVVIPRPSYPKRKAPLPPVPPFVAPAPPPVARSTAGTTPGPASQASRRDHTEYRLMAQHAASPPRSSHIAELAAQLEQAGLMKPYLQQLKNGGEELRAALAVRLRGADNRQRAATTSTVFAGPGDICITRL